MAANWESLRPERDPRVDSRHRARFLGAWREHRATYGYTLLAELPYALRAALRDHADLEGLDYNLLIVDEYQDLNPCDLEVIRLIADRGCAVIGAGDDDQSIYSFRKAAPEGIRRFPQDYPGASDYTLSVTQRCGASIVEWATYVIEGDPDRDPGRPRLQPREGSPPGEVALLSFTSDVGEVRGVGALVENLIKSEAVQAGDILVLLRSDYGGGFSQPIKRELARRGIPVVDPDAVDRLLAEDNNRKMLEVLRLLVDREDSLAWASLLLLAEGVGERFLGYVYELARRSRVRFGRALLEAYQKGFPSAPVAPARRARGLIDTILRWIEEHPPDQAPGTGWGRWIVGATGDAVVPAPTQELASLLEALDELSEPEAGLGRYLGQIAPLGRDLAYARGDGVRIMTMTKAKGLTVRAAVIAALEEGIMPRPDGDLAEERRLLYVAMTRPRHFLYCTWARRRRGPTARAGEPRVWTLRSHSTFLDGGPVASRDGATFLRKRWPKT